MPNIQTQQQSLNRLFLKKVLFILFFLCLTFLPKSYLPIVFAQETPQVGIDEKLGNTIPTHLEFKDEHGKTVTIKDLMNGKPTVIGPLYYSCPGICNLVIGGMTEVLSKLDLTIGQDYNAIAFSFNHHEDPQDALKKKNEFTHLLKSNFPQDRWKFLTGSKENILELTNSMGYYFKEDSKDFFMHPTALIVVSPEGKVTRYLYGKTYLPLDLKLALMEASEGKTGPAIAKMLDFCFSYDPEGQKYVFNFTKVSGSVILILALGFFIFLVFKKK